MTLLNIAYEFLKIGLFAVGGGLAVLPFLNQLAYKYDWLTHDELTNMIAISESMPGPLGVNVVTFVGFRAFGIAGGFVATIALITPSVILITLTSRALQNHRDSRLVANVFTLLRPMSVGLIVGAVLPLILTAISLNSEFNPVAISAFVAFVILVFATDKYKPHPLIFIAIGGIFGILFGEYIG
ncbi:MAG: chromate transporter [Oscillospiraceae bacterium]|nr:chromate transporter [Oscillospiraceae bacterium]